MIVVLGLPVNIATIILSCIFSMLLSDFRARGLRSIPTLPMTELTEFLPADADSNIHPLPISLYFTSASLWWYMCSCMHTMSMLCSTADAASSDCWPVLFKVLTINVAICIVRFHLSNFHLCLSFLADFFNNRTKAPTSTKHAPFFVKGVTVSTYGFSESHGNLLMVVF